MKSGFAAVLLSGALLNCALAAEVSPASSPATSHRETLRLIEVLADRYAYKPEGRTEGAGGRPFERFVKALDPERMIFTEAELAAMASQRVQLNQAGDGKQLEVAQAVFATYLTRSTCAITAAVTWTRQSV